MLRYAPRAPLQQRPSSAALGVILPASMKTIIKIAAIKLFIVLLLALALFFSPSARFIGAHLGMAVIAILSMRPDKNLDYSITVRTPGGETLNFNGQTGCDHKVKLNGSGYKTMNRISTINHNDKDWILLGIDCNFAIDNRLSYEYKLYQLTNEGIAYLYFIFDGSSTRIIDYRFRSSFTFSMNKNEADWPNYNVGPYFYRKVKLNNIPWQEKNNMQNRVIYTDEICGKENSDSDREKITKDDSLKVSFFESYITGTLAPNKSGDAWIISDDINLKKPNIVSKIEHNQKTNDRNSKHPAGCVLFGYKGHKYLLSASGGSFFLKGAFLYLPTEESIIQVKRVNYYDIKKAMEDSLSWSLCYQIENSITAKSKDILIDRDRRNLIRYNGNNVECSKYRRLRWL